MERGGGADGIREQHGQLVAVVDGVLQALDELRGQAAGLRADQDALEVEDAAADVQDTGLPADIVVLGGSQLRVVGGLGLAAVSAAFDSSRSRCARWISGRAS
ncbi:hypothetical protein ABZ726_26430 [Streptomyces hundungensis]|uniref:hypothetical protein n=1 Tax=Streptomyces hundungensis TaxID=1077946 RepID=UPI0033DC95F4